MSNTNRTSKTSKTSKTGKVKTTRGVKQFTIDRGMWACGTQQKRSADLENTPDTALLNSTGLQCCLGFYAAACGVPDNRLLDVAYPPELEDDDQRKLDPKICADGGSGLSYALASINDAKTLPPKRREQQIATKFKTIGVTVRFKGTYPTKAQLKKIYSTIESED